MMAGDSQRVVETTTINYNGMIAVLDPTSSWTAKWLHVGAQHCLTCLRVGFCSVALFLCGKKQRFALCSVLCPPKCHGYAPIRLLGGAGKRMPGCYALRVQADLPQHIEVSTPSSASVLLSLLAACSAF